MSRPSMRVIPRSAAAVAVAVSLGVVVPTLWEGGARADERSDAVEQQQQATQRSAELTASLEGVSAELGQAYLDLQAAQASLDTAQTALTNAETTLAEKQREQQAAADRLSVAQADLQDLEDQAEQSAAEAQGHHDAVASLVVATYQGDSSLTSWTYVLNSSSVGELSDRASTMEIASGIQESALSAVEEEHARDANRQARQDAVTQRVTTLSEEANAAKAAAQQAADEAQTQRDAVASLTRDKETAAATLEKEKSGLEEQLQQAEADAASAAQTIAAIDAANRASAGYVGAASGSASIAELGGGAIAHPITGPLVVASPYGYRIHPITGTYRLHAGVDLVASQGTPQYAAVSGTVYYNQNSSCGNGIIIDGGVVNGQAVEIAYCHLSGYSVAPGVTVSQGQQIGLTGMTGGATGPHVHFEVYLNGATVDPMTLPGF